MSARPIRWQFALTLLVVIAVVLAIHSLVVVVLPPPQPLRMTVAGAVAALGSNSAAARAGLERTWSGQPPAAANSDEITAAVASALRIPSQRVRARWLDERGGVSITSMVLLPSSAAASRPPADAISLSAILAQIPGLPPFEAAVQQDDGRWLSVAPRTGLWTPWRRQAVTTFLFSALLLTPLAWLVAGRLTGSMRRLAASAAALQLARDEPAIAIEGPREVREVAQAMRAAVERLRQQTEERSRMVAAIAHDLRTPLTGLRLRLDDLATPTRERVLADIDRMEQMIARVLEYVRSEQDYLNLEPVDVAALVHDCVAAAQSAGQAVHYVNHAAVDDSPITLHADALALHRALGNLLENAARYAGGAEVRTERRQRQVVIAVSDRGPGVPPDQLQNLLQAFARLDRSRNGRSGGVGLGLSIAAAIARRHGGQLLLRNREGGGLVAELII